MHFSQPKPCGAEGGEEDDDVDAKEKRRRKEQRLTRLVHRKCAFAMLRKYWWERKENRKTAGKEKETNGNRYIF